MMAMLREAGIIVANSMGSYADLAAILRMTRNVVVLHQYGAELSVLLWRHVSSPGGVSHLIESGTLRVNCGSRLLLSLLPRDCRSRH
jgi:hypothetical protein